MRQKSATRRKREAEAKPVRDALRSLGHCEICGDSRSHLDVHEICRGPHRQAALDKPFALLLVCRKCHDEELAFASKWPEAKQLACLAKSRPSQFDLHAYLDLTSPKAPRRIEIEDVLAFMEEDYLTKLDVAKRMQVDKRSVQNWVDSGQLAAVDCRTAGSSKPLYRVAWSEYLRFCKARQVK